jgi:hypothetical protein
MGRGCPLRTAGRHSRWFWRSASRTATARRPGYHSSRANAGCVSDIYHGTEHRDLGLVDPDIRAPVDFAAWRIRSTIPCRRNWPLLGVMAASNSPRSPEFSRLGKLCRNFFPKEVTCRFRLPGRLARISSRSPECLREALQLSPGVASVFVFYPTNRHSPLAQALANDGHRHFDFSSQRDFLFPTASQQGNSLTCDIGCR